jgi:hypothetical protein
VNENIYRQPLVLLLGAGASVPLGRKTTDQFLEWLKAPQPGIDYGQLVSICNQIQSNKQIGGKLDVEVILDHLEELIHAGELFENYGDAEILRRLEKESQDRTMPHSYGSITRLEENRQLRDRIRDLVVEHYSEIDAERVVELYTPLLARLTDFCPVIVFTTNYDLAIERLHESGVLELIDGFSTEKYLKPRWSREAYDFYHPSATAPKVVFFKLHGSVDWVRTPLEGIQRIDIPKRDLSGAQKVIAYPSQLKKEIHEEPYRTSYDYLIACLSHARVCGVIGFSFRDQEIVEEFRQAMDMNEELTLIIVDPKAEAVQTYLEDKIGFSSFVLSPNSGKRPKHVAMFEEFSAQIAASVADKILSRLRQ